MTPIQKFKIKQNDTSPALAVTLKDIDADGNEAPVNLTGSTVVFHMRARGGATKVTSGSCTITAGAAGTVKYPWAAIDTDTVGRYDGEFQVTFADGSIATYPRDTYVPIEITDDIA